MKKFKNLITILLALSLSMSCLSLTACSDSNSRSNSHNRHEDDDEDDKDRDEETEESEETEDTSEETTERETSETTEETTEETMEETTEESTEVIIDIELEDDSDEGIEFDIFRGFVEERVTYAPDARYSFYANYYYGREDEYLSSWTLASTENGITSYYAVTNDGEVVLDGSSEDDYQVGLLLAEDLLELPLMIELYPQGLDDSGFVEVSDGEYYGGIVALNDAGTTAIVTVGDAIYIDQETYDGLGDSTTSITDLNGNTFTVNEIYNGHEFYMTDDNGGSYYGWFIDAGDGTYIMSSDSDVICYCNERLACVTIADDCEIIDRFAILSDVEGADQTVGLNPDEPLTITNSYFYDYYFSYAYGSHYNQWFTCSCILEPVTIVDGEITSMTIGWR